MRSLAPYAKAVLTHLLPDRLFTHLAERHYLGVVRSFAAPEASLAARLIDPGDHVLDLGANVGWYTRVLAEAVGPAGRVYSLEPIPRTFRFLEYSVRALGLTNVTLFNCAASDHDGTALMQVPREAGVENFYQATIVPPRDVDRRLRHLEVRLAALDTLLADLPEPITFIKCDVEGHEAKALMGARRLITRFHPAMFVELSGSPDDDTSAARDLVRWLETSGYGTYWLRGDELRRRARGDRAVNYFFLTGNHVQRLLRLGTAIAPAPPSAAPPLEGRL
jgi:FkbM family methyltransferase